METGEAVITASFQNQNATATVTVTAAEIVGFEITPATATLAKGQSQQFIAAFVFTDGSTQNVSEDATWTSSESGVATVSDSTGSKGLAQSLSEGSTTITASLGDDTAEAELTVTPAVIATIEVTPTNPSIAKGTTQQFAATAILTDGTTQDVTTTAQWESETPAVAAIRNDEGTEGLAEAEDVGSSVISATLDAVTGSTTLTVTPALAVSLQVTPTNPSVAKGLTQQFTATATFTDGSNQNVTGQASWASSSPDIATVSDAGGSKGLAQALEEGSTTISAEFQGHSSDTTLTVTPAVIVAIEVSPADAKVPVGTTQTYQATAVFSDETTQDLSDEVNWASSDEEVIEISNTAPNKGVAAGRAIGTAVISATHDALSGETGVEVTDAVVTSIQISPTNAKLAQGFKRNYQATGLFSDGSNRDITADVTWSTSDTSVATISNAAASKGLATGVAPGTVVVSAQLAGVSRSTPLTVTDATLTTLEVNPDSATVPLGNAVQFTAIGTFSDGETQDLTTQVTWGSSDTATATVSNAAGNQGRAQSVSVGGPVDITATSGAVSDSAALTVSDAALVSIAVSPATATAPEGRKQAFKATGTYTDDSVNDITDSATWSSNDTDVATVSNAVGSKGVATGEGVGSTSIMASSGGITGTATINVTDAVLESITVTPAMRSLPKGRTQQYSAEGSYSDGTVRDVTDEVQWTSSNEAVATISNAAGSGGLATAEAVGSATISAALDGQSASAVLEVTAAVLDSIAITPPDAEVPAGLTRQLTATGTFSDGSTENLTADVTWSSSDAAVAEVSNGANSRGLAIAKAEGSVTVTALDPGTGIEGETGLTVIEAVLEAITISPSPVEIPVGFGTQLTAMGEFSDGVSRDITDQVDWGSLDPGTVSVENSGPEKGYARAHSAGSTTVVASLGGVSGTAPATALDLTVTMIDVTPKNASFGPGGQLQYTATASFADGSQRDVTLDVTWASSNTTAATISNSPGTRGLASAGSIPGDTTISATAGGVTGSTTLTRTLM